MAWEVIPDSALDSESEIRDAATSPNSIFKKIRDNLTALLAGTGSPTPPKWLNDAFTDNNIAATALSNATPIPPEKLMDGAVNSSAIIQAGTVGVSKLAIGRGYAAVGDLAASSSLPPEMLPSIPMINPGGIYFLGYQTRMEDNGYTTSGRYVLVRFGGMGVAAPTPPSQDVDYYTNQDTSSPGGAGDGSPFGLTYMLIRCKTPTANRDARALINISYLEASPPYHLGGYEAPFFLYAMLGPDGTPVGWWGAGAPPWAYNGPTDITPNFTKDGKRYRRRRRLPYRWEDTRGNREKMEANLDAVVNGDFEDIEVTPEFKNSDMAIVPQPFLPPPGFRVVLVDPLSNLVSDLRRMDLDGDDVCDVLSDRYLDLENEPMVGAPGIPNIPMVRGRWRVS